MKRLTLLMLATLSTFAWNGAQGQTDPASQCSDALVLNERMYQRDYASRLRLASRIDQSNFEEAKRQGAVDVVVEGIPFSGSYDDYQRAVQILRSSVSLDQQAALRESSYESHLSSEGVAAFTDCMRATSFTGTQVWLVEASREYATVHIRRIPPAGTAGGDRVRLVVVGGQAITPYRERIVGPWEQTVLIRRTPGEPLSVTLNGGGDANSLILPRWVRYIPEIDTQLLRTSTASARSTGSAPQASVGCGSVPPDYHLIPSQTAVVETERVDERRSGAASGLRVELTDNGPDQVCVTARTSCAAVENWCWVSGHALYYVRRITFREEI